jgi:hypothetical protein
MSTKHRPPATCPVCSQPVEMSKAIFSADFQCGHCGALLRVSKPYGRTLSLFGVLLGYPLAWEIGSCGPRSCGGIPWGFYLLCLPLTFLILSFLVRIAPYLVIPTLVTRRPFESHLTTLDLSVGPGDELRPASTESQSRETGERHPPGIRPK